VLPAMISSNYNNYSHLKMNCYICSCRGMCRWRCSFCKLY